MIYALAPLQPYLTSLALGLLIGLERQHPVEDRAGLFLLGKFRILVLKP